MLVLEAKVPWPQVIFILKYLDLANTLYSLLMAADCDNAWLCKFDFT